MNGDSLSLPGKGIDINSTLSATSKGCNCILDVSWQNSGNELTANINRITPVNDDPAYTGIQNALRTIISGTENHYIKVVENTHNRVDELEMYGGMLFVGSNNTISITDQWITGKWNNSGMSRPSYRYALNEPGYGDWAAFHLSFTDSGKTLYAMKGSRYIPFSEAISHEIFDNGIRVLKPSDRGPEENRVISIMNSYRAAKGIPLRPNYGDNYYKGLHNKVDGKYYID